MRPRLGKNPSIHGASLLAEGGSALNFLPSRSRRPRMKAVPHNSEPSAFDDARVAAEAAPTTKSFFLVGGASAPNLPSRSPRPRMKAVPHNSEPSTFDDARVAAEAAPTQTHRSFCRRGFRPEPLPSRSQRPRMKPPPPIPNLPSSMAQGSRLKPLLPKDIVLFGRRGFSPESAFKIPKATDEAAPHNPEPSAFDDARVAAEAAPTQTHCSFW
jgi:hypothetical protein